ncbi:FG-GAP-like repeat-containing protein [Thermodesulfobacteriota bacterium]
MKNSRIFCLVVLLVFGACYVLFSGQGGCQNCTDDDDDGYAVEGGNCGSIDCDDEDPGVNPGAVEGPYGDLSCSDGLDNDCDGLIDIDDPGCPSEPPQFQNVTDQVGLSDANGFRVSVADVNCDDYPDIYVTTGAFPKKQYLYVFDPVDQVYIDLSEPLLPDESPNPDYSGIRKNRRGPEGEDDGTGRHSEAAVFGDVDNDGDLDLFSILWPHDTAHSYFGVDRNDLLINQFMETGEVKFELSADSPFHTLAQSDLNAASASFCDYDYDGNIDLFVGNYYYRASKRSELQPGALFRGDGAGGFTNTTVEAGIDTAVVCTVAVSAFDFNNDGLVDLCAPTYANAYTGDNRHSILFQNDGDGTFTQKQDEWNYDTFRGWYGHKSSFGTMPRDFDNDGDLDFIEVITHGDESTAIDQTPLSRSLVVVNDGNIFNWEQLYNSFTGRYTDDGNDNHHGDHYACWFDMNNDGLADIALTENGYGNNGLYVFRQTPDHAFELVTDETGLGIMNDSDYPSLNVTPLDYDLDGDEDLIVGTGDNRLFLFENGLQAGNNWAKVILKGRTGSSNAAAVGAKVEVITPSATYTQTVDAGNGHAGPQAPLSLHFGLGVDTTIDTIRVTWPNASHDITIHNGTVNTIIPIEEDIEE